MVCGACSVDAGVIYGYVYACGLAHLVMGRSMNGRAHRLVCLMEPIRECSGSMDCDAVPRIEHPSHPMYNHSLTLAEEFVLRELMYMLTSFARTRPICSTPYAIFVASSNLSATASTQQASLRVGSRLVFGGESSCSSSSDSYLQADKTQYLVCVRQEKLSNF